MNNLNILEYYDDQVSDENYWMYLFQLFSEQTTDHDDMQNETIK